MKHLIVQVKVSAKMNGECFLESLQIAQQDQYVFVLHVFYGSKCQFNTNGFGLSLDAILGYHISPHTSFYINKY